jgi:ribosomal protein S12 methylthiotransferase accessory factor
MMEVSFPGGVAVEATFHGHTVRTDQPAPSGADSAMSPFDLFFASLATCMGFYALRFCQERQIATEGLRVNLNTIRTEDKKRVAKVAVSLTLPTGFPEKYRDAILRAVDHCAVKRTVLDPPEFEIEVR